MIALFDEPPRGTLDLDHWAVKGLAPMESACVLVIGIVRDEDKGGQMTGSIVCLWDGRVRCVPEDAYTLDWRYNVESDQFRDISIQSPEEGW